MKMQTVDFTHPRAGQMFVDSLRQTGFALIKQHPVPQTLLQTLYAQWQQFFLVDDKLTSLSTNPSNLTTGAALFLLPCRRRRWVIQ